jgi:ferritin-like protein
VNSRIELRHILTLVGALAGVAVTAAALWLPDHVNWVRVVGTTVGLLTAALAIRIDWLHNINRANQSMTSAQRKIASAKLGAAQRRRNHVKLQATLSAELEIVRQQLDTAASLAYRTLNDRSLNRRLRALESSVKQEIRQVHDLEEALAQRKPDEWDDVDQHIKRLRNAVQEASRAAAHLATQVQQGKNAGTLSSVDNLEQKIRNLSAELARWTAIAA